MDRAPFAPPNLFQEAKACAKDVTELIEKWHGRGRCLYAVTPRFAITATSEQLALCGEVTNSGSRLCCPQSGMFYILSRCIIGPITLREM